jgi:ankyrin repeat protein
MTIVLALSLPPEKAKAVVKLLLELGATSAQADMNHLTVLHYVIGENKHEILDLIIEKDRPVALSVLNNIGSSQYGYQGESPLITAILKGYEDMVAKLLSLGAKPTISFDDWIKMYLSKNDWAKNQTAERNMEQYKRNAVQPIIAAAGKEMAKTVQDLLAHGADPCTLEKNAHHVIEYPQNSRYQTAEALLDVIQKKLTALRG